MSKECRRSANTWRTSTSSCPWGCPATCRPLPVTWRSSRPCWPGPASRCWPRHTAPPACARCVTWRRSVARRAASAATPCPTRRSCTRRRRSTKSSPAPSWTSRSSTRRRRPWAPRLRPPSRRPSSWATPRRSAASSCASSRGAARRSCTASAAAPSTCAPPPTSTARRSTSWATPPRPTWRASTACRASPTRAWRTPRPSTSNGPPRPASRRCSAPCRAPRCCTMSAISRAACRAATRPSCWATSWSATRGRCSPRSAWTRSRSPSTRPTRSGPAAVTWAATSRAGIIAASGRRRCSTVPPTSAGTRAGASTLKERVKARTEELRAEPRGFRLGGLRTRARRRTRPDSEASRR